MKRTYFLGLFSVLILVAAVTSLVLLEVERTRAQGTKRSAGPSKSKVKADVAGFRKTVAPFLQSHCTECHGPRRQRGELSLHDIDGSVAGGNHLAKWKSVAERLILNEMPPESVTKRPDTREAAAVLAWIKTELAKAGETTKDVERKLLLPGYGNRIDHQALFSGKVKGPAAAPPRVWRMSPQIYTASLPRITRNRRLLNDRNGKFAQPFSVSSAEGFKDYAALYVIDEPTLDQLIRNAKLVVEAQVSKKTNRWRYIKEFQPLVDPKHEPTDEEIQAAIGFQFQMALLREPTKSEMARMTKLFDKNVKNAGQVVGAKTTLATVLLLPEALYRFEKGTGPVDKYGRRMLSPRELAYAIAFALTDDSPDAELLKAAESGKLGSREDVRREVTRILNDKKIDKPRIMRFFEEFFEFLAVLEIFKDVTRGQWRPEILVSDTRRLIQYILDRDQNVLKELLTTNKSFVNYSEDRRGKPQPARIANKPGRRQKVRQMEIHDLYGLPEDWKWNPKQPIELPGEERAGILTQPAWLAAFATNNENHAIRRGKWVRERLLGGVVPDLPITVDAQLPHAPEQTLRQRMAITEQAYCWQCHQKMNPLGLSFENFDHLGRHRTKEPVVDLIATREADKNKKRRGRNGQPPPPIYKEVPVDASGLIEFSGDTKLDGSVKNAVQMIKNMADSPKVRQVFVRHAFRYWMGRNELLSDSPSLIAADQAYVRSGGSMKALITELLASDSFLYRQATGSNK
ncbi:MAG: DUF1588 domain-containing protein [Gemmataceae bacterium]